MKHTIAVAIPFAVFAFISVAVAQVKMEGTFVAAQACDAVVSIKKGTNPDNAAVKLGQSYRLLGENSQNATHYWVDVPGAQPAQRWVAITCGSVGGAQAAAPTLSKPGIPGAVAGGAAISTPNGTVKPKPQSRGFGGQAPYYVLALSWEPAFCEAMRDKAECKAIKPASWEASHLTLHGLWPQPRRNQFCGVDTKLSALDDQHQWESLPEPPLSTETKRALDRDMPGTQSVLERHEWIKHGTCYPGTNGAEGYFKDEMRLADAVNASPIQTLFASYIGKQLTATQIRSTFDQVFGPGAGIHVEVDCDRQGRLEGIVLNLRGDIPGGTDLKTLLMAGDKAMDKCDGGVVDLVR